MTLQNVLVIGNGGREFAIAKKLKQSPKVDHVYCAPGNVGMPTVGVEPVAIEELDFAGLIKPGPSLARKTPWWLGSSTNFKRRG